jgi:hypothetical protein
MIYNASRVWAACELYTGDEDVDQIKICFQGLDLDSVRHAALRRRGSIAPQASQLVD